VRSWRQSGPKCVENQRVSGGDFPASKQADNAAGSVEGCLSERAAESVDITKSGIGLGNTANIFLSADIPPNPEAGVESD